MGATLEVKTILETKEAEKNIENLSGKVEEGTAATEAMTGSLDKMSGGAITAFKGVVSGVKKGVLAMKTLKGAIIATGVGALVVVVGTLISYFQSTQKGANMVDKAMAGIGATIDVLIDRMSTFGGGLMDIMTGNFSSGLDKLAGSFKGITEEIVKEASAAVTLETASQKLLITKRAFIEQEAKLNSDLEKYRVASEDFDLSTSERLAANTKAQETSIELANNQMAIAKEELRLLSEKNSLGEGLNADLDAEAEAKARLFQIEQSRDSLAKEFQAKAKGITDEQKNAAASLLAEKKAKQAEQDAEDIINASEKATKIEAARLEAMMVADNNQRQYELENDEIKLVDLLVFAQRKMDLELEQLDLSEAEKESIRLKYQEKESAANIKAAKSEKAINVTKKADNKALNAAKIEAAMSFASASLGLLTHGAKEGSKIAKVAAIAQVTFDSIKGTQSAYATAQSSPITLGFPAYPVVMAGLAAGFGALQIKKIASSTGGAGSSGSGSFSAGSSGSTPSQAPARIPNFNAENLGVGGRDSFDTPIRAVVINQDIKDNDQLDSKVNDLISIGK